MKYPTAVVGEPPELTLVEGGGSGRRPAAALLPLGPTTIRQAPAPRSAARSTGLPPTPAPLPPALLSSRCRHPFRQPPHPLYRRQCPFPKVDTPAGAAARRAGQRDAYRDELTHVDEHGDVRMVDVGEKAVTQRLALAEGSILMHPETQAMVLEDRAKKGDVLACARVAGIMASKRTSDLIPMCHPLNITKAKDRDRAHRRQRFYTGTRLGTGARGWARGLPRARNLRRHRRDGYRNGGAHRGLHRVSNDL